MGEALNAAHQLDGGDAHREGALFHRKLLYNLRHMTVNEGIYHSQNAAAHRVRRALVGVGSRLGGADAALDTRLLDQPRPCERQQRRDRRGRVAADAGDQARGGHLGPMQLRQAVDGLRQELRRRMIHAVPVFIRLRAVQAEIRRKIDYALSRLEAAHRLLCRGAVRQRKKSRGGG